MNESILNPKIIEKDSNIPEIEPVTSNDKGLSPVMMILTKIMESPAMMKMKEILESPAMMKVMSTPSYLEKE